MYSLNRQNNVFVTGPNYPASMLWRRNMTYVSMCNEVLIMGKPEHRFFRVHSSRIPSIKLLVKEVEDTSFQQQITMLREQFEELECRLG